MKIGLIAPGGFDRSGEERVVPVFLWLVERLARSHEVHVYTLYQYLQPAEYTLLGARVHNIGYRRPRQRGVRQIRHVLPALRRENRRGRFDVLHGLWANESGLIAGVAGRLWDLPSVVSVLGGELVGLPEIGYGAQLRLRSRLMVGATLRLARAVTAASRFTLHRLQAYRPDARLIPLGVDTYRFSPPEAAPPSPPWRLLHVASLNRVKDQPTLLRAFHAIHAAEPDTRLDVIGEDTLDGEIQRLARDLEIDSAVAFHGFRTSARVADCLRRSHLLLHSSRHEAGEMVTLEAAACGVPAIGTDVGHIADLAPEAAVTVPVGDYGALAWAALALLRDEASRKALGQRALAFVRAHDADWTAAQFETLYAGLIHKNKGVNLGHPLPIADALPIPLREGDREVR
ncbi:MAG TPA: glycosyltransferase family 4 protein [Chthonomonadaceae bacterium]|nr:glycosyltransferase family 4 protein [Chthonomonadaceae bacterium]